MWLGRKIGIALPALIVLVLARCSSELPEGGGSSAETEAGQQKAQTGPTAADNAEKIDRILEKLEVMERADREGGDSGGSANTQYSAEQIKAAMQRHIERRVRLGKPGVFEITDPYTSQTLELKFQKIHDPVRVMPNGFYFACTNFEVVGQPKKTYDLDFWLQPKDGELVVYQENVHKAPVREDGEWVQDPYYNFVDDRINLLE